MSRARKVAPDRHRAQRGSILSSVLIIVVFLSILVGAIMTELTNSFLTSATLVTRTQREATVTSAVELGIHQLQAGAAPAVCARDARGPWYLTLNSSSAAVTETCQAIVPDLATGLAAGASNVDGVHNTTYGRNEYIVGDSAGRLWAYTFGQTAQRWSVALGGPVTAAPLPNVDTDGQPELLVPVASGNSGCGGWCVEMMHYANAAPSVHCAMPASSSVTAGPAFEATPTGAANFPDYAFFYGSGAGGNLYVYDAAADHTCPQLASAAIGGAAAGPPLVFSGVATTKGGSTSISDEIFVVVSGGGATSLEHWRYTEETDKNGTTISLGEVASLSLTNQVGASTAGYDTSAAVPSVGGSIRLAIAGSAGRVAIVSISVNNKLAYNMSLVTSGSVPGAVTRSPTWCHCPGQDLIGLGSSNGNLYLLSSGLSVLWTYDGSADGSPAIHSVPAADSSGDWYFGAADGYVYDVEVPAAGQQMFKAARFGPGGTITSSPVVGGAADGCGSEACVYFSSTSAGGYFVRVGGVRIIDLRACVSMGAGSTTCRADPRLWARVEVGSPAVLGGSGVFVQGWSYYSP